MKISVDDLRKEINADITTITELKLSNRDIDEIEDLSCCVELKKVDLSKNKLSDLTAISENKDITMLNISNNHLLGLSRIKDLTKIAGKNIPIHSWIIKINWLQY